METYKIVNFLNTSENEYPKFATKKMVRYLQRIKRWLFASQCNKVFNKVNRIKS